ncbi:2'-5' RNA ligase family protein [Streptomyces olivoreticuli]
MDNFFDEVQNRKIQPYLPFRKDLHWHVALDIATVRKELVEPYRELTHRPGIAPVAARDAHVTLLHDGPLLEFAPGEIEKITELVRAECATIAPFDITLDRPAIGRVAIECPGRPGQPARRLWEMTARVSAEVTGNRFPRLPQVFHPHLSIGYSTSTPTVRADRAAMKVWLSDCPRGPVTLTATALNLVAQWHTRERITWDHLAAIPLGGPPSHH